MVRVSPGLTIRSFRWLRAEPTKRRSGQGFGGGTGGVRCSTWNTRSRELALNGRVRPEGEVWQARILRGVPGWGPGRRRATRRRGRGRRSTIDERLAQFGHRNAPCSTWHRLRPAEGSLGCGRSAGKAPGPAPDSSWSVRAPGSTHPSAHTAFEPLQGRTWHVGRAEPTQALGTPDVPGPRHGSR